ncbi:MAG: TonB-dependent receptor [Thermodesulfobacteriota bacterium]
MKAAWCLLLLLCLLATTTAVRAETPSASQESSLQILSVEGEVEWAPAGTEDWQPAAAGQLLRPGDQLRTGARARAMLRCSQQGMLRVRGNSRLRIAPPAPDSGRPVLDLLKGMFHFFNRGRMIELDLRHRLASAATRGTEFVVRVESERVEIAVIDGQVSLHNALGEVTLGSGELGAAVAGQLPWRAATAIETRGLVQWCLYYPAVLAVDDLWPPGSEPAALAASLAAFRRGDFLAALRLVPPPGRETTRSERLYRAGLWLVVGEVDAAAALLETVPADDALGRALALLIASIQGEEQELLPAPSWASEWLAQSYAHQARAELDQALAAARAAVALAPASGLAWTRLAELFFSFGQIAEAKDALTRAVHLAPQHPEAMTMEGFLHSADNEIDLAIAAFERAIAADGGLGRAWLGRGLCRIRQGEAAAGREDLLVAAALEPHRALFRSYLGKALSDDHQFAQAQQELDLARRLDPEDPTPWLYSALNRHQANEVNEAIADLERSKALNRNRALYRSRLLLDQDRAVRGANLARIYQDAGLPEVAFRAAVAAVADDYANFSSHLFLANSYEQLRDPRLVNLRYETAAHSEYLLANLLAPVGAGTLARSVSQEEYSPLFEQDRPTLALSTLASDHGSRQWTAAIAGTSRSTGYAVEHLAVAENGFRPNNDLTERRLRLTLKEQLRPADTMLLLAELAAVEGGDLRQLADPSQGVATFRFREQEEPFLAAGYRHDGGPERQDLVLVSLLRHRLRFGTADPSSPGFYVLRDVSPPFVDANLWLSQASEVDLEVISGEWQHIATPGHGRQALILGLRGQGLEMACAARQESPTSYVPWLPSPVLDQQGDARGEWLSLYGYHHWRLASPVTLQLGLAYEHLRSPLNYLNPPLTLDGDRQEMLAPKLGLIWSPGAATTLRAGYARALTGASLEQSLRLEPVQVAGFTQAFRSLLPEALYGSIPGTRYSVTGGAVEHQLPTRTYLGLHAELLAAEASQTLGAYDEVSFGLPAVPSRLTADLDYRERTVAATVHQLLGDAWALGVAYRLSRSQVTQQFLGGLAEDPALNAAAGFYPRQARRGELQQLGLRASFNHASGWYAAAEAQWTSQTSGSSPADQGFWQAHAWLGYRLAGRNLDASLGLWNLTDQDYRLSPLTPYSELPHERTWLGRLSVRF